MSAGFSNANNIIILNKYFKKRVGLAFGILFTGFGIGGLAMPQVISLNNLIESFSSVFLNALHVWHMRLNSALP